MKNNGKDVGDNFVCGAEETVPATRIAPDCIATVNRETYINIRNEKRRWNSKNQVK